MPPPATPVAQTTSKLDCSKPISDIVDRAPPSDWKLQGRVAVVIKDGQITSAEARDLKGTVLKSNPITPSDERAAQHTMTLTICQAGGLIASPAKDSPSEEDIAKTGSGALLLDAFTPAAENEKDDLVMLCREPEGISTDKALRHIAQFHFALQWLTSPKWRSFLRTTEESIFTQAEQGDHTVVKKAAADAGNDLATKAAASGFPTCAYAEALKALASE